jgi:hypothetical protein
MCAAAITLIYSIAAADEIACHSCWSCQQSQIDAVPIAA